MFKKRLRLPVPLRTRATGSEFGRAMVACVTFAALFLIIFLIGTIPRDVLVHKVATTRDGVTTRSGNGLTTGSIVFMPVLGNKCRRNLIDNATWIVRAGGIVPCSDVLEESRQAGGGPATRLDVIRQSFRAGSR